MKTIVTIIGLVVLVGVLTLTLWDTHGFIRARLFVRRLFCRHVWQKQGTGDWLCGKCGKSTEVRP